MPRDRSRWRWLERALFATGAICLVTVLASLVEGRAYQLQGRRQLEAAAARHETAAPGRPESGPESVERAPFPAPAPGQPLGTIRVPGTGLDAVILEGVDEDVLRRGVGHFPRTPMPGRGGNFALAGHRDTFFRGLRHVREGQRIVIATADGREHAYRVERTEVVEPTRVDVLDDRGRETLTLVTCYPFGYVGPAPRRFVVVASPAA